jgi:ubiquitin-protein ligase
MKEHNAYKHHYATSLTGQNPPQTKINRLVQEISDLGNSLPMEATNAIFVRYDSTRMDLMKACIFGAAETPYAHGAFIFDMYFDD